MTRPNHAFLRDAIRALERVGPAVWQLDNPNAATLPSMAAIREDLHIARECIDAFERSLPQ